MSWNFCIRSGMGRMNECHLQENRGRQMAWPPRPQKLAISQQEGQIPSLPHPGRLALDREPKGLKSFHITCCSMWSEHKCFHTSYPSYLETACYNFIRLEFQGIKNPSDKHPPPSHTGICPC